MNRKYGLASLLFFLTSEMQAIEYAVQFENEYVHVAKAKLMPQEEVGLHRDANPQIVIALQGGTITRLEADGTKTDVAFPTGKAVYREADPSGELHKSINKSSNPVELVIIQLKYDKKES